MFFLFSILAINAQELDVKAKVGNPSNIINNGFIDLEVTGGEPPYQYKWSDPETSLESSRAEGLTEGVPYEVTVTDSQNNSVTRSFEIEAEAITEHFNGTFVPIVEGMTAILFWDPFTAVGIYDPKVYAEQRLVPTPDWSADAEDKFTLKEWRVEEGAHVEEGDLIAIVGSQNSGDLEVMANATGTVEYLVGEGETIWDYQNSSDLIETNAHMLAQIQYDEPQILTNPNGTPQKHNIPFIVVWLIFGAAFFTVKMGFMNFKGFKHSIELARGKYDEPNAPGSITHFQALATAVSATVGLGNIAGVAVAISLGGAGIKICRMYTWSKISFYKL